MAKEGQQSRLESITQAVRASGAGLPPVHLWNPPDCGDIDMRIAVDGTWYYNKTPITRPAMVQLFASIMRREGDKYYLVTPVEKCGIAVDDAPFLAVEVMPETTAAGPALRFRLNVGDDVVCGPDHRLRFERQPAHGGLKPYLHVRRDLWACVTRPVYYELADLGEERVIDSVPWYGVVSEGEFFAMAPVSELEDHGA
ncbi:MAG TPA: DUF1285 domain-containing protein [Xanthobacteraceae bacterium]|nr:DUF1285 domain-containing protein [Xanthobacteraceae bacterium]